MTNVTELQCWATMMKYLFFATAGLVTLLGCGKPVANEPSTSKPESKVSDKSMLSAETKEEIALLVRTAFYGKDRMLEILCEEMHEPGELDPNEVSIAIEAELAKLSAEQKSWPKVTDCDRLEAAFAALEKRGVIALHNAGYTQSDGHDDFREAYSRNPNKSSIVGYCFYHGQDVERAIHGGGLYFAFGPVDSSQEKIGGPVVGKIVREELERSGLQVDWDGTFATRLNVPKFNWQRR